MIKNRESKKQRKIEHFARQKASANSMQKISHQLFSMWKISHRPFLMRTQCEKFRISQLSANSVRTQCEKFHITHSQCEFTAKIFAPPTLNAKIFASPFHINNPNFALAISILHQPNLNAKKISHQPLAMRNTNGHLTAKREAKSHLNFLFKGL